MNGKVMCFFGCQEELAGKGYHEGVDIDGQDVAIAVCSDCVGSLGVLLADITSELEDGMSKAGWLRQALERLSAEAWEALALHQEGTADRQILEAAVCRA